MMKKTLLLAAALLLCNSALATQLIQGNVKPTTAADGCPTPAVTTFTQSVQAVTYDEANGIWYVGLADGGETYAVSSFQRTLGSNQIPTFKPRAVSTETGATLVSAPIPFLAMATATGDSCSRVAGVDGNQTARVFILDITNKVHFNEAVDGDTQLRLYTGALNTNGDNAINIVGLDASRCFIFAAVTDGTFGDQNSGVAVVSIDQCTLDLHQTAAVPGDRGIKAAELDLNSTQLKIPGTPGSGATIEIQNNTAQLLWDDQLERLYAGVSLNITGATVGTDGGISVVVGTVGQCPEKGTLVFQSIAVDSAFTAGNTTSIIGEIPNAFPASLTVNHMGIMHASTGPSYLIVNGGNGTAGNQIFALPLVDKCDADDAEQGLAADKTMFDVTTHRFRTPATTTAGLAQSTDQATQVGNGPLPLQPNQTISYMQVIGDAVYVSIELPQSDSDETGILYSQAQFDNEGKIQSWTPWTKRLWPICGFPNSPSNAQVSFFAVDAVTGKVMAIDGAPQQTARITEWTDGLSCDPCATNCSLAAVINKSLCEGAYSVLDLDQSTTGIGQDTAFRYALFGGTGKVDFALISQSRAGSAPFDINTITGIPYPQRVTIDYCCPDFFLETELTGCVTSLEYSRRSESEGNTNYFFAGTANGLYVFADPNGNGFDVSTFGLLSTTPFTTGKWHKIATLSGPITDIKTSGNTLYVMTFETSCERPFYSEIKRIDFTDNINTMFTPGNITTIAISGPTPTPRALQNTLLFTQMEIIQTSEDATEEELVLTTNNGIFQSKRTGGVQDATSETDADWTILLSNTLFYGIGAIDNASLMSTVWPFSAQDACGYRTFERSSIHQLNGQIDPTPTFNFVPSFFNHIITCDSCACTSQCDEPATFCCPETAKTPCQEATTVCSQSCEGECCCVIPEIVNNPCSDLKLFEKINYFWSDGGRRFFIITPTNSKLACLPCCGKSSCNCCPQQNLRYLEVTPFNTCAWNVCDPIETVLRDCVLRTQSAFYWVRPIGMTGIILAGTQTGVVALE